MTENFSQFVAGFSTFLIGIVIVFAVLILLIWIIQAIGNIVSKIAEKNQPKKEEAPAPVAVEAAVTVEVNKEDELELIAVITAVIAASLGTTSDQLQVKSLRKVQRKAL